MDVINTLSLTANTDTKHRIHFLRDGEIRSVTLAEVDRRARVVASRLRLLGVGRGDRVGIMSVNCIEWIVLDLAVLKLGGVVAGYDAGRFDETATIERYGLRLMFVERPATDDARVFGMDEVGAWAESEQDHALALPAHEGYGPEDICAIKFTSGSMGPPKGMEATVAGINDSLTSVQEMFQHGDDDNILVFLRLAQLQQRYWHYSAFAFGHDHTLTSLDNVLPVAQATHPTVIMGVPGFFEDVKRQLEAEADYGPDDLDARRQAIQSIFGGRIRYLWTGSAPASGASLGFYNDCGVPLYQGYGLNETCIVAKNCPGANRVGSVGKVLPNKSVRFDERGVLIVGSRNPIIKRYTWCSPGDNERLFMPTGEIITHDLGYLDENNYLYILGRVDDLIVLSTGRNILVAPIEERVRNHPAIHECVLYGHGKPFLTALISPASDPADREAIKGHIRATNETLFPEQRLRGIVISPERFSIENEMLTSQFKPVRREIHARLASEIEAVYAAGGEGVLWTGAYGQ
jgi:long-subunit acyl-CoA synthetase (AMP-forming)